ncbi:Uncharacterized protein SCF082_LOCUS3479 [Durusdinium trenchii]|uniref:Uncharacterized protein n=1 Tax=Durusdinium trenchii TaxID=1381693 RepID=A0ABP0HT44_9DINO
MSGKRERPVVSRQWSCSELVEGHGELLAAKKERESDDELQLKIKEYEEELARLKNEVVPQIKDKLFFHVKAPEAMLPKNPKGKKKEPKGTTTPPPQTRPVATPVRPGQVQSSSVPSPQGASGNPALQKRQRGKQPDPDKDRQIEELKKAGAKMQARLEALTSASSNDRFQADAKDPQTKKAAAAKTKAAAPAAPSTESEDLSHAAKMAKLRRMCERKPSGKIKVPDDVHKRWVANEGDDREKMLELLEDSNWDKDWPYIKSVVAFCRKSGNEKLIKKDRYNKKLEKFHVVFEEGDESVSELEEVERQEQDEGADSPVTFKLREKKTMDPPDLVGSDEGSGDESANEKEAKQTNGSKQEFERFKAFTSSLLSRASKIADMISELEAATEAAGKGPETADGKRVAKLVTSLEDAMGKTNAQHQQCECIKAKVAKLPKLKAEGPKALQPLGVASLPHDLSVKCRCSSIMAIENAARSLA